MQVFALEVGTTEIRSALVRDDGQVTAQAAAPTDWGEVGAATVRQVLSAVKDAVQRTPDVFGVGLAVPGAVSAEGTVLGARSGQENWRGTHLRQLVEQAAGRPAVVANDGALMTLGEYRYGAGQGAHCLVGLRIDDGIAAGIVAEGRMFGGARGLAGDLAHVSVDGDGRPCQCGARGCLAAHVAGLSLEARYRELTGRDTAAPGVVDRAESGEVSAATLMRDVDREIRLLVQAVMAVADPDRMVVGGTLGLRLGPRLGAMAETLGARRHSAGPLAVVRGTLGPQAALLGAAAAVLGRVAALGAI